MIWWWWWWTAKGSSPYGSEAPSPYRQSLCAPQSDINSVQPCPFTTVPDGPQSHVSPIKETSYTAFFSLKVPASESPPRSPLGPLWRQIPPYREFLPIFWYMSVSQRPYKKSGPGSSVSIATDYGLDGPGIESSGVGGLVVSMLASGTQDRGFALGRSRRIFPTGKIHSMPSFGRGSKIICPMLVTPTTKRSKSSKRWTMVQKWKKVNKKKRFKKEIFRTRPDRPWGPPSLLYTGYRVFPGGRMRPGRGVTLTPHPF
jgi:hypothetical protein